jgi:ribosome recycling factor
MSFISDAKPQFEKALDHLVHDIGSLRTGRANPSLVEDVSVEAYGTFQALKTLAAISTPDSRTIAIDPWDGSITKNIESALQKSDIGIMPAVDGKTIRLSMPMMTDENRQRMVKILKEKLEEARVAVRRVREEAKKKIEKEEGVSRDDIRSDITELEIVVKEYMTKVDMIGEKKEKEVTTI